MTASHLTRLELKHSHKKLGLWLAFIAGAMNAGGFLIVGRYTSHMTGIASSVGDALAVGSVQAIIAAMVLLGSFIGGATSTAMLVNLMRDRKPDYQYSAVLMLESALLLLFIAVVLLTKPLPPLLFLSALLCFLMGLQNAMITKISGAIIRTTHITGLATDIGIELGRTLYRRLSGNHQMQLHPEKSTLFASLMAAFIFGGIVGATAIMQLGVMSLLPLTLLLAGLSITLART